MTDFTGKEWEEEVVGSQVVGLSLRLGYPEYLAYRVAMREVVKFYDDPRSPWDPEDPNALTSDLSYYVAEALGTDPCAVRWYPALRRSFDIHHGVDLFCMYCGMVVTIDLTVNPDKGDGYKADEIWSPSDDLKAVAARIAERLSR